MATVAEVKAFVIERLQKKLSARGVAGLDDELSLIDSGLVDSFGLLDLVQAAEKKFQVEIDVSSVDIDVISKFGGFAKIIADAG